MRPGGLYSHHSDSNRSDLRPLRSNGSVCSSNCESVNSGKSSTKTINTEASENVHVVVRCRNRTIKEKTLESPVIIQLPDENQHGITSQFGLPWIHQFPPNFHRHVLTPLIVCLVRS